MPTLLCSMKSHFFTPVQEACPSLVNGAKITRVTALLLGCAAVVVAIAALVFAAAPTLLAGRAIYLIKPAIVSACTLKIMSVYFLFLNYLFNKRMGLSQKVIAASTQRQALEVELAQLNQQATHEVPSIDEVNAMKKQVEEKRQILLNETKGFDALPSSDEIQKRRDALLSPNSPYDTKKLFKAFARLEEGKE